MIVFYVKFTQIGDLTIGLSKLQSFRVSESFIQCNLKNAETDCVADSSKRISNGFDAILSERSSCRMIDWNIFIIVMDVPSSYPWRDSQKAVVTGTFEVSSSVEHGVRRTNRRSA